MEWEYQVPLKNLTTFRAGGLAARLLTIRTVGDLGEACEEIVEMPYMVLGGGSNVLFPDSGYHGAILKMEIEGIESSEENGEVHLRAGAGVPWDTLVAYAVYSGWWGLENLSGIPGTVGATPIQNVGAYGVEVREVLHSVEAYDPRTKMHVTILPSECAFGYRDSAFKHDLRHLIITHVTFTLSKERAPKLDYRDLKEYFGAYAHPSLEAIRDAVIAIRARKFPDISEVGCAGSTFKNPIITHHEFTTLQTKFPDIPQYPQADGRVKIPLAYVLQSLGWKGYRKEDAGVWKEQALIVVNYGNASSKELATLIEAIIDDVKDKTNIAIEPEIAIIDR